MSNFTDGPLLSSSHRVSVYKEQGGRHHMEDVPMYARNNYDGVPEGVQVEPYDYIAIFDGHGGSQASTYASEHLLQEIICQKEFWSNDDVHIQTAIRKGFINCHYKMWRASKEWPASSPGIMCTAGTTASVAFVRHGKAYIGHVGDSGIALGKVCEFQTATRAKNTKSPPPPQNMIAPVSVFPMKRQESGLKYESRFEVVMLTKDHKPESPEEKERIESLGGEVRNKSGVCRVVWKRPITVGTELLFPDVLLPINPVPFLAVARSLGDFWSYEEEHNEFVVSPVPDVTVHAFSLPKHHCLIAGSDGLWNVIRPNECLEIVEETYRLQELWSWQCLYANKSESIQSADVNVAELLVRKVLNRCELRKMRSDNVGVVVYYPAPSEEKIRMLLEQPKDSSPYPWLQDPDQGIAHYRHSLMHLQNMVSCIGANKTLLSMMEIAYRIDIIGFSPRMRCNPLRDSGSLLGENREVPFEIDHFIPQCAVVMTKEDENVRIPAYERLTTEDDGARINPLRRRTTDVLLSQRIKFLRTHSNQVFESSTVAADDSENPCNGYVNSSKRLRVAPVFDGDENQEGLPTFLSLPFSREDFEELGRLENYPYVLKDH